jgi:hypothetical protein
LHSSNGFFSCLIISLTALFSVFVSSLTLNSYVLIILTLLLLICINIRFQRLILDVTLRITNLKYLLMSKTIFFSTFSSQFNYLFSKQTLRLLASYT